MHRTARDEPDARRATRDGRFPSTRWSLLLTVEGADVDDIVRRNALEQFARIYWKPIYAHIRLRWRLGREEAEDLTQDFFMSLLEGPFLQRPDPTMGRFRNFVLTHLDLFVLNALRGKRRLRRGGGRKILSLFNLGENPDALLAGAESLTPDEVLLHYWRRSVLDEALRRLESGEFRESHPKAYEAFLRYDLSAAPGGRPTYEQIGADLEVSVSEVGRSLMQVRAELYRILEDIVAESVDGPEALREELAVLFQRRPRQ